MINTSQTILSQKDADNHALVKEFIDLAESYYKEQHGMEFYLRRLNISKRKLNRIIKNQFNTSPEKILKNLLSTAIKKELVTTETPMKELSQLYGFNSPAMLTKFVKSTTGISPSKYRALNYVE